eukprot:1157342-Pelagomonas_calceolata.AAC.3
MAIDLFWGAGRQQELWYSGVVGSVFGVFLNLILQFKDIWDWEKGYWKGCFQQKARPTLKDGQQPAGPT